MEIKGFIIMGISGSGKTTIGRMLAEKLDWEFIEADKFHPSENIAKMSAGIPLDDSDRAPWLSTLHEKLESTLKVGRHPVLACSALKESYRATLTQGIDVLQFVYLKGDYDLLRVRLSQRKGHYMRADMLRSQFEALEEPADALVVDVSHSPEEIIERIMGLIF